MTPRGAGLWTAAAAFALDQGSKLWLLHVFGVGERQLPIPLAPFLDLTMAWNKGVSYSWFTAQSRMGWLALIAPAILSGVLLAFAMSLDDVIISFFVSGSDSSTFPVYLFSKIRTGVPPSVNAMCTLLVGVTFITVAASRLLQTKGTATQTPAEPSIQRD